MKIPFGIAQIGKAFRNEIIARQQEISLKRNQRDIGKVFEVLIEGKSKRSDKQLQGRNCDWTMPVHQLDPQAQVNLNRS